MTDITELAQREKFEAWFKSSFHPDKTGPYIKDQLYFAWKAAGAEMVEALEKAQQERENWRTSFDNERFRADKLKAYIDDMEPIRAAAEKLVRCKGRYHSEQNYRALAALFGVKTPDLPPLENENVHYADAAEMEIAALRQRIAELESHTVKLPKPISVLHRREFTAAHCAIYAYPEAEVNAALAAAGIKWEVE
ncbi:Uncharacterised protein [Klebsiella pneumoniae]|uniref:ead/Ea22-like family protein n=1 Tax=Klebsiella pneumoniae TaxID=573 RepID=UPI000E2B3D9D|nr:ead/Ea22-like family protein [Klebsiella pneumoniae]VVL78696.1 Uncharacterised protein [Klebsiella pneumoniae]